MEKAELHASKMASDNMWKVNIHASLLDGSFGPIAKTKGVHAHSGFERDVAWCTLHSSCGCVMRTSDFVLTYLLATLIEMGLYESLGESSSTYRRIM